MHVDETHRRTAGELALLPPAELAMLQERIEGACAITQAARATLQEALELKYRPQVDAELRRARKEAGTVTLEDGDFQVKAELPKTVRFEASALDKAAKKFAERGEDPAEWLTRTWSLNETRFKGWPKWAQQIVRGARQVGLGRLKVVLAQREKAAA